MKYALKLARHGSVFLARVVWIGGGLVVDLIMLLLSSTRSKNLGNLAAPEVPDPLDRGHPNWEFYWGERE